MATKVSNSSSVVAIAAAFAGRRAARACAVCANRSALWYCAADEAHLCRPCDAQVHAANAISLRHERVRLSPDGLTPTKSFAASQLVPEDAAAPASKRSRGTSRSYSHHLRKLTRLSNQLVSQDVDNKVESEESIFSFAVKVELGLFDNFLSEGGAFLHDDGNQEVPSLSSSCCSSDLEFNSSDESQEGNHSALNSTPYSASADSFVANVFKGKAAHSQNTSISDVNDQFRVPDAATADTHDIDLAAGDEAFLFPGDIPGLDDVAFERFVPEMDLVDDDFSLSFNLALCNSLDAFDGHNNAGAATSYTTGLTQPPDSTTTPHHFLTGPFAKFFAARKSATDSQELPMGLERIKREAREMLQCCRDGDVAQKCVVPSLELNVKDVLAAWSAREEPWICLPSDDSTSSASDDVDVGLVPDMEGVDHRDARVLRYKEKRRTRLFSKTIRYEVRKLNAERRPRMKGRFVKRTTTKSS